MGTYKLFIHTALYFLEIIMATSLIRWLIEGNISSTTTLEFLKETVFAFTLYQLLLLVVFKLKDSIETDALNTIKSVIDKFQVYAEFKMKIPVTLLNEMREKYIDNRKVVLNTKYREILNNLILLTDKYNRDDMSIESFRFILKQESLRLDLGIKITGYYWINSVLLRILK
jgi:hypothetical protein